MTATPKSRLERLKDDINYRINRGQDTIIIDETEDDTLNIPTSSCHPRYIYYDYSVHSICIRMNKDTLDIYYVANNTVTSKIIIGMWYKDGYVLSLGYFDNIVNIINEERQKYTFTAEQFIDCRHNQNEWIEWSIKNRDEMINDDSYDEFIQEGTHIQPEIGDD